MTGPDECDFNGHLSNSSYAKVVIILCQFSINELMDSLDSRYRSFRDGACYVSCLLSRWWLDSVIW